jgi:hypothetical protein
MLTLTPLIRASALLRLMMEAAIAQPFTVILQEKLALCLTANCLQSMAEVIMQLLPGAVR